MWGPLCLCSYASLKESSLFVALSVVRIRVMRVMMCEAAVFCARVTLRLTPHSQPNVFLILSIPHHQSLPSDSNHIGDYAHTHTSPYKHVTCIQTCAQKTWFVHTLPDTVTFGCIYCAFNHFKLCARIFESPLATKRNYQPSTFFTQANRPKFTLIPKVKRWGHCSQPWITILRCKHRGETQIHLKPVRNMPLHIDSSVVNAMRKTFDIPLISHPPMWDTKANIRQIFFQQCLPLWFTAVIGLGWT